MFCLQPLDPQHYRRQTRKVGLVLVLIFAVLGMALATLSVRLFGEPGGNNFGYNLGGVLAGLLATALLVHYRLQQQPWMREAVYGLRLKRNLMRVTNVMHHVQQQVEANDPAALKLLRFYHLALEQMHQLDGNDLGLAELQAEKAEHETRLHEQGVAPDQRCLDPEWLRAVSSATARA